MNPAPAKKRKFWKPYRPKRKIGYNPLTFKQVLSLKERAVRDGSLRSRWGVNNTGDIGEWIRKRVGGDCRRHSIDVARQAVRLRRAGMGVTAISRQLGIPLATARTWIYFSHLPKEGRYCLEAMIHVMSRARDLYRAGFHRVPRKCLWRALRELGYRRPTIKVYLHTEAMPALPGFPIYADPAVQARCEKVATGERLGGSPLYDPPEQPYRDDPTPIAPAPELAKKKAEERRAAFLVARKKALLRPLPIVAPAARST